MARAVLKILQKPEAVVEVPSHISSQDIKTGRLGFMASINFLRAQEVSQSCHLWQKQLH